MTTTSCALDCFAYVSNAADGDIAVFHLDGSTGQLRLVERVEAARAIMPMALSTDRGTLYAATRGAQPTLITYSVDTDSGHLARLSVVDIPSSLAYLSTEPSGRFLLGASYGENRLTVYDVKGTGTPLQSLGEIKHAHSVLVSPDARSAYVASLGSNQIFCFDIRPGADGRLSLVDTVATRTGFGPRHMRFSPDGEVLYVVSEFSATVARFRRDPTTGCIAFQCESTRASAVAHLDDGRARPNFSEPVQPDPQTLASLVWAADIHVRPDGRFVYASERTSSRVLVYQVNDAGHSLTFVGFVDTEAQPRGFSIDPSGTFLIACGEKSSHVAAYRIDASNGQLSLVSRCAGGHGANWIEIVTRSQSTHHSTTPANSN